MKILIQFLIAVVLCMFYSSLFQRPSEGTVNTLYSVSAILFSVGIGLVVTVVPNGIKNKGYLRRIKGNLNRVRNCFFIEFLVVTGVHLLCTVRDAPNIHLFDLFGYHFMFDPIAFELMLLCLSLVYYYLNFIDIQRLNNDIFEATNKD